jgi:hypothetical protein
LDDIDDVQLRQKNEEHDLEGRVLAEEHNGRNEEETPDGKIEVAHQVNQPRGLESFIEGSIPLHQLWVVYVFVSEEKKP